MPTWPSASTKVTTSPVATGTPKRRSVVAKAAAIRSTSPGTGDPGLDQRRDAGTAHPLLVLAVLEHRAEGGVDPAFVELGLAERRQCLGPVDDLGHAGRLEQLEAPHPLDGAGDLAGQLLGHLGGPQAD